MHYPDEYLDYEDPETGERKKLKLKNYFPGVPEESWGLSDLKYNEHQKNWTGKIPDSQIPIGAQSSGYYVDENHFNDPRSDRYYRDVIIHNVGNTTFNASNLLSEAKDLINQYQYEKAKDVISEAKDLFNSIKNVQGMTACEELIKSIDITYREKLDLILKTKHRIHYLILKDKLERCNLFPRNLDSICNQKNEIKKIIEKQKIHGFFMYKFPEKKFTDYKMEIERIFDLIDEINKNPYIQIDLPKKITGLGVKTCEFCKIARAYDFGILLLSPENVNAYLEAGMFLSLGKKVICLRNKKVLPKTPFDLDSFIEIVYDSLDQLESLVKGKLLQYFEWLIKEYCK